jgi:hypothetical protein
MRVARIWPQQATGFREDMVMDKSCGSGSPLAQQGRDPRREESTAHHQANAASTQMMLRDVDVVLKAD